MIKTAKIILTAGALMCAVSAFGADPSLKVYDVDVTVNEKAQTVTLNMDLNLKDYKIARSGEAIFTPVIISENGADSVVMNPVTICGRNRYYYYMRAGMLDSGTEPIYRAGKKGMVRVTETVPLQPWMLDNGTVEVRQQKASCCSNPKQLPGDSPWGNVLVARMHNVTPVLDCDYVFSPPMEDQPVEKSYEGKAFVTFVVNRTELNPTYMDNPAELRKITGTIDIVKADPDAIITEVHIRGYASPEGAYANNVRLAMGRTETLANYVNSLYHFERGIITTSYDPEDWGGLRSYVADSLQIQLQNRAELLEVIDGPLDFDARDWALKSRFPKDYQILLKEVYPWLRHSDYAVKYQVKVYSDLENLNRIYRDDPTKLRAVDFYTIAQQYPAGSPEYLAVMKKAIEIYPDQPMINLNVANLYMMEGDFDAAQRCLNKSGDSPQADYGRGVLAAKRGDFTEAERWFRAAKDGGIEQAATYLRQLEEARDANPVDILVHTTK